MFGPNETYRNASYQLVDDGDENTTLGLISFTARTGHDNALSPGDFELDELAPENGLLSLLIEDFSDGDGGISFTHDSLSSLLNAEALIGNLVIDTPAVTDPMRISVGLDRDVIDGVQDGWVYGGGATIDSDNEHFNFGEGLTLGVGGVAAYVLGAEEMAGTEGADQLAGGVGDNSLFGLGGADTLAGGTGDDFLDGGDGDDQLFGDEGHDALKGGAGRDAMAGGAGDDSYEVDDIDDVVTESAGEGNDTIVTSLAAFSLQDVDNVENLFFGGTGDFAGSGDDAANRLGGGAGNDTLSGGAGDDSFESAAGSDAIDGGDGADVLLLEGGRYRYDFARDGAGVITVTDSEDPREIVLTSVEAVFFAGTGETWGVDDLFGYFGTEGDDVLSGNALGNALFGMGGNDTLAGGAGSDSLDGGTGADAMAGGTDDDTYFADDSGDTATEAAGEGYDSVVSSVSYTLGANLEELVLAGSAAISGTGNALDNWLGGNDGANLLQGLAGNDTLDGGEGADTMQGGTGNDVYIVDVAGDVVTESYNAGSDEVRTALASYTLGANVERLTGLAATGQTLTGNSLANVLTGGAGADVLSGGSGSDTAAWSWSEAGVTVDLLNNVLEGDAAGDTLISIENLTGGSGADTLSGTGAANILDGGAGADLLTGRGGNDVYLVDDEGDVVVEAAGEGSDEIRSLLGFYTLAGVDNVETLRFAGVGGFTGIGGDGNDIIFGGAGNDQLEGGAGYDMLTGGAEADDLIGGADGDVLDGGLGADYMEGGTGSDTYLVDDIGDEVVELAGEGVDQVQARIAEYTLADGVENLTGTHYGSMHFTGNGLGNFIIGGYHNDTLEGLAGNDELRGGYAGDTLEGGDGDDLLVGGDGVDLLTGGAGADTFRYSGWDSAASGFADRITDFAAGEDKIDLALVDAGFGNSDRGGFRLRRHGCLLQHRRRAALCL